MTREEQQKRKQDALGHDYLRERLHYDPTTGIFTWNRKAGDQARWNAQFAEKRAGSITYRKGGYATRSIIIDGVSFLEHRLAWFYMTGEWPNIIDHDNRDATDNRWDNLIDSDYKRNAKNLSMSSRNQSGVMGVSWKESFGKWTASMRIEEKETYIGSYDTIEEAEAAVRDERIRNGYSDGHGMSRGVVHTRPEPLWPLLSDNVTGVKHIQKSGKKFRVRVGGVSGGSYPTLEEAILAMLEIVSP